MYRNWFKFYKNDLLSSANFQLLPMSIQNFYTGLSLRTRDDEWCGGLCYPNGKPFSISHIARLMNGKPYLVKKYIDALLKVDMLYYTPNGILCVRNYARKTLNTKKLTLVDCDKPALPLPQLRNNLATTSPQPCLVSPEVIDNQGLTTSSESESDSQNQIISDSHTKERDKFIKLLQEGFTDKEGKPNIDKIKPVSEYLAKLWNAGRPLNPCSVQKASRMIESSIVRGADAKKVEQEFYKIENLQKLKIYEVLQLLEPQQDLEAVRQKKEDEEWIKKQKAKLHTCAKEKGGLK